MEKPQKTSTEMRAKDSIRLAKAAKWILLVLGALALIAAIASVSSILAFIGLGLVFWGVILIYVQTNEYTKKILLDASVLPSLEALDRIIQELHYEGKAVYLPPKYFKDPQVNKIFIPKQKDLRIPTQEQIMRQESQVFTKEPEGILLTPLGAELAKLFERTLNSNLAKTDLQYLEQIMPKLFIELEIAENLEMKTSYIKVWGKMVADEIHVIVTNSIYNDIDKENRKLSYIHEAIGCPISSAIACTLAKATGKPVIIEKHRMSEDGRTMDIEYRLLEEI